jgi:chorismate mutase
MTENRDETMTRFLIPTNTKILYTYEIKVDNYDFIYGIIPNELEETPVEETPVEETPIEETPIEETPIEETIILNNDVSTEEIVEALAQPDIVLSEIEYVEDNDAEFEVAEDEPGVEVIGVVWPERAHKNKVYRYDPNGEELQKGDIVLVPTRDAARDRNVIRKAAVAHENHRVDPEHIKHTLKKIIGVIKRKAEEALTTDTSSKE